MREQPDIGEARMVLRWMTAAALLAFGWPSAASAEMRGHGGPVRALAVLAGGHEIASGSFDQSAIVWDLEGETARAVLRFHDGAVNAVAALPDGGVATGGADGRIALWRRGMPDPVNTFKAHQGPIAALAVSPDGRRIGSASWDGTARITQRDTGSTQLLEGHSGNVNAIAFAPDGAAVTAGYDGTLRRWPIGGGAPLVVALPTPLNAVAVAPDGTTIAAGADGVVRIVGPDGAIRAAVAIDAGPVTALALSPAGERVAAASITGAVVLIDLAIAAVSSRLAGLRGPVWALVFTADGRELVTGGNDGIVRRWDLRSGEPIGGALAPQARNAAAAPAGDRGAQVFAACAACHSLEPDGQNRAGPTLYGVFGRRIAASPGYRYSEALKRLDIVWTADTIARLFEVGPAAFTPGTKMPEQRVNAADRAALVTFLEKATRPEPYEARGAAASAASSSRPPGVPPAGR